MLSGFGDENYLVAAQAWAFIVFVCEELQTSAYKLPKQQRFAQTGMLIDGSGGWVVKSITRVNFINSGCALLIIVLSFLLSPVCTRWISFMWSAPSSLTYDLFIGDFFLTRFTV